MFNTRGCHRPSQKLNLKQLVAVKPITALNATNSCPRSRLAVRDHRVFVRLRLGICLLRERLVVLGATDIRQEALSS